jgi:DNA-binding GntR family transcriptional regulator
LIVDEILDDITATMTAKPATRARSAKPATRTDNIRVLEIVDSIRERIRKGRLVPGQRLVEADIMRELAASRGRVREALQRLSTEGLVTIEEFRGASVTHFTHDQVRQIYRARMALEGLAARDFAEAAAPRLKDRLERLQGELNEIEHTGDHKRFARLNDEWHRLIIEGSGNQYVRMFVERLRVPIYRLLFSTFYNAQRIDSANAGHRRISEAILKGRAKDAEKLMREHIQEGFEALAEIDLDTYE